MASVGRTGSFGENRRRNEIARSEVKTADPKMSSGGGSLGKVSVVAVQVWCWSGDKGAPWKIASKRMKISLPPMAVLRGDFSRRGV
jgi:hypothetical protein